MSNGRGRREIDRSLAIRAAWLHYAGGLTQAQVAERLGVTPVKAHRLIAWANQNGAVKVSIVGEMADCAEMEGRIAAAFGLTTCEVVPDLMEPDLPLRALGTAGASFLEREIARREVGVIGLGHGRTLAAAVEGLPRLDAGETRFVSLMGGLTRNFAANPFDVMHKLAERTGAGAFVLPVPFFANSASDREVLMSQRGVAEVFALAAAADVMVVGIGTAEPDAQIVASGMVDVVEMGEAKRHGAVAEMLGHFFGATGQLVTTSLSARTLAPDLGALRDRRIVALAGGPGKTAAIAAALRTGLLAGLITDEATARALIAGLGAAAESSKAADAKP